jgi:hypothetical protein
MADKSTQSEEFTRIAVIAVALVGLVWWLENQNSQITVQPPIVVTPG